MTSATAEEYNFMSLCCDETKQDIEYNEPLFAGTRADVPFFSALSEQVLSRIPISKRCSEPCSGPGINIHKASSSRNFNGSYTLCDFKLGDFLYSISLETAKKYLPNHLKNYLVADDKNPTDKFLDDAILGDEFDPPNYLHPEDCISHKELIVKELERSIDLLDKSLESGLTGKEAKWIRKSLGLKKLDFLLVSGYDMQTIDSYETNGIVAKECVIAFYAVVLPVIKYALIRAREDLENDQSNS